MRKSRFTEEDVVAALSDLVKGNSVREVGMKFRVSETTIYQWRAKFEGLQAPGVARIRELEEENCRLRRLSDLQTLHIEVLKAELARSSGSLDSKNARQEPRNSHPQSDCEAVAS